MSANSFSLFTEYVLYKNQGRTKKEIDMIGIFSDG